MAKSAKERMAEYRRRKRENPYSLEEYKAAERDRYRKRRETGKIKLVHELSFRGQRNCRRQWVKAKRSSREKQKMKQSLINNTPPPSPEIIDDQIHAPPQQNPRVESMKKSHKRRSNKQKAACYRTNKKMAIKLQIQGRLTEKYKRRYNRLKSKFSKKQTTEDPEKFSVKSYKLYQTLIMNVRKWYGRSNSRLDRQMIADVICSKRILKKYALGAYCTTVLGISRRYMKNKSRIPRPSSVRKLNMKESVRSFLERDDNSRLKADKQATITRKGVKKQVRLLSDDLKTLHKKFQLEGNKMSYSLFCDLRPFWTIRPTEKDRNTCLCKIHANLSFKINTSYAADMITSKDPNVLMKYIVCDAHNKQCMYRECGDCGARKLPVEHVSGEQLTWNEWTNKRIEREKDGKSKAVTMTVKEKKQGTKETLRDELDQELQRACRHYFNIRHQYQTMRLLKEKMSHEEVMLHVDFSENYNTKYESEIQSMHFGASRRQISLHTGVAYIADKVYPFCTVSDCLKHGPAAIWAHMEPVIYYIKTIKPLSAIHFLTDGPTTQYRNKMNFYLWSNKVYDYGFNYSSWNFLEAAHGKGAADGIGAAIKRAADHQVNVKGRDIACAEDLVACVQPSSSVKLFLINESSIRRGEELLPTTLIPIPGTMKLHQVCPTLCN